MYFNISIILPYLRTAYSQMYDQNITKCELMLSLFHYWFFILLFHLTSDSEFCSNSCITPWSEFFRLSMSSLVLRSTTIIFKCTTAWKFHWVQMFHCSLQCCVSCSKLCSSDNTISTFDEFLDNAEFPMTFVSLVPLYQHDITDLQCMSCHDAASCAFLSAHEYIHYSNDSKSSFCTL